MVVIDLFSGAGGLTEGFFQEGYKVVAHVEKEKWACETLKTRICYHYLRKKDIELYNRFCIIADDYRKIDENRKIIYKKYPELEERIKHEVINKTFGNPAVDKGTTSTKDIIKLIEKSLLFSGENTVSTMIGGPPCQAYSLVGRGRMTNGMAYNDKRNFLFYYYLTIVKEFSPNVFVFENVPGILNARKGKVFEQILEEFDKIGYTILTGEDSEPRKNILDAMDFGVCQTRKRVIIFGFKKKFNLAYPDLKGCSLYKNWKLNTRDAISDLPFLRCGEGKDFYFGSYKNGVSSEYQKLMRAENQLVMNHKARSHKKSDLEIYVLAIDEASAGRQLDYSKLPHQMQTHKKRDIFTDRFKVHWWDDIPHTIVAHISKDGHYNIHPDKAQLRSLTVREAARIQSFPDDYRFEGPRTWQYVQVGNAVPPLMGQTIAKAVKERLLTIRKS